MKHECLFQKEWEGVLQIGGISFPRLCPIQNNFGVKNMRSTEKLWFNVKICKRQATYYQIKLTKKLL